MLEKEARDRPLESVDQPAQVTMINRFADIQAKNQFVEDSELAESMFQPKASFQMPATSAKQSPQRSARKKLKKDRVSQETIPGATALGKS